MKIDDLIKIKDEDVETKEFDSTMLIIVITTFIENGYVLRSIESKDYYANGGVCFTSYTAFFKKPCITASNGSTTHDSSEATNVSS